MLVEYFITGKLGGKWILYILPQADWVVDVCCDFLVHQLSTENYQVVLQLADKYQLGDLCGDIFRFLGLNVMALAQEQDFYINFDHQLLTDFLRGDVFVEADEEFVLELITKLVDLVCLVFYLTSPTIVLFN